MTIKNKEVNKTKESKKVVSKTSDTKPFVKVKRDANLAEVIFKYPEAAELLTDYGLHCVGCFASSFDTIEMGAKVHGMSDEDIDEMVDRLNEFLEFHE